MATSKGRYVETRASAAWTDASILNGVTAGGVCDFNTRDGMGTPVFSGTLQQVLPTEARVLQCNWTFPRKQRLKPQAYMISLNPYAVIQQHSENRVSMHAGHAPSCTDFSVVLLVLQNCIVCVRCRGGADTRQ